MEKSEFQGGGKKEGVGVFEGIRVNTPMHNVEIKFKLRFTSFSL